MDERAKAQARERARRYRARKRGEEVPKKKPGPTTARPYIPPHYWREDNVATLMGRDSEGRWLWSIAGKIAGQFYAVTHWDGHRVDDPDEWVEPLAQFHYEPGEPTYSFITHALFDGLRLTATDDHRGDLVELLRSAAADETWSTPIHGTQDRLTISDKGRRVLLVAADDLEAGAPYAQETVGMRPSLANRGREGGK